MVKFSNRYLDLIKEDFTKLNSKFWAGISLTPGLPEEIIREFHNYVYWNTISSIQQLSEDLIQEFSHKVNWYSISISQKLSEEFIVKFSSEVDWWMIFKFQNLSEEFILKFATGKYLSAIHLNPHLARDVFERIKVRLMRAG